jgi:hypothetical protein
MQTRERDKLYALEAHRNAERSRRTATSYQLLIEKLEHCTRPGFFTREGENLTARQEIGLYIMQKVFSLYMEGQSQAPIGSWSDMPLSLQVAGAANCMSAQLLLHVHPENEPAVIGIQPLWMRGGTRKEEEEGEEREEGGEVEAVDSMQPGEEPDPNDYSGPQQWRIAYAVEHALANAPEEYQKALERIARAEQNEKEYEAQAQAPFPQEGLFRKLMARKMAIDAHTAQVASGKLSVEEIEEQRQALLKGAMRDYSKDLTVDTKQQEEVFALSLAVQEALAAAVATDTTTPAGIEPATLFDMEQLVPEPVSSVLADRAVHTSIEKLTRVAEQEIEKLDLEQLVAVSLFDDIAPRTSQRKINGKRHITRKKEVPTTPQLPVTQEALFGSLV